MTETIDTAQPGPFVALWQNYCDQKETISQLRDELAAAEARNATLTDDAARLDWLRENSCDLRCIDVPTGAGDGDVHWVVVEHYMAKPHEREIGRAYSDEPREAIDAAIQARAAASISTKGDGHG